MERLSNGIMRTVPLGVYISVPFCRTKCSYCNFASDVFSRAVFERYVDRVCSDIANAERDANQMSGKFEREVDSIYLGGGTPSTLEPQQLERLFTAVRNHFEVTKDAEITVECAPGTLSREIVETLFRCLDEKTRDRAWPALDIAAGAVLLASLTAAVVGLLLFVPKLAARLGLL